MRLPRTLVALVLFGVAFAYVEAAVVVYLRVHYQPIRRAAFGERIDDELFPMLQFEHLEEAGPQYVHMLHTELGRELATLFMLAAVGLAVARNFRQWLAGFMIAFGVWDVFFYLFLKLLIGWPESLLTWDILFLLPVPWLGPVISPVLVAAGMIAAGVAIFWREARGRPVRFAWFHWVLIFGGALIIIAAFCWDWMVGSCWGWQDSRAGGSATSFNWPLFILGEAVGLGGFVHAFFAKRATDG
jgi:hypothetical protein